MMITQASGRIVWATRLLTRGTSSLVLSAALISGGHFGGPAGWSDVARAHSGPDVMEDELLEQASSLDCQRWREADEPFDAGATAAIRCPTPAPGVAQLALFAFPDHDSLGTHFRQRLRRIDERPPRRAAGCADGRAAVATWRHGRLVCWIGRSERPIARMRWTDERTATYGVADASHDDIAELYHWWSGTDLTPDVIEPEPVMVAADFAVDPRVPTTHDERVAYLLARVADQRHRDADGRPTTARCRALDPEASNDLEPVSLAAIACEPTRRGRNRHRLSGPIHYFLFPSAAALDAWWQRTLNGAPGGPIPPWSGSFDSCFSPEFLEQSQLSGATGWRSEDGEPGGRVACWVDRFGDVGGQGLRWTVDQQLVGGSGSGAEWFTAVHDHIQAYPPSPSIDDAVPPFVDADTLPPLDRERGVIEPPAGPDTSVRKPDSVPGLPVGVIHPVAIEPCYGFVGFPADVDGSFWQATGGVDPDGEPIRSAAAGREFDEFSVVEFVKTGEDEAQMRTPGGYVVSYERQEGPRRFMQGCS